MKMILQENKATINIVLVIGFLILSCTNPPDGRKVEKVLLKKVNFDISSMVRIKCDNFETYFKEELQVIEINDTARINKLQLLLKKLKSDSKGREIDVRAKLILFYSDGTIDSLCMNRFRGTLNGKPFLINQEFLKFVKDVQ